MRGVCHAENGTRQQPLPGLTTQLPFQTQTYGAPGAAYNRAGRIMFQEDASGWQTFSYGKLGEVTENIRTFALPFESRPYTFKMKYKYDSFNRMQQMTYPDGEVVRYCYNLGGMLDSIGGSKNGVDYPYVTHIAYNQYELKDSVLYGNGSLATYDYDNLMRLAHLQSFTGAAAEQMQDITYDYDAVNNITHIDNQAPALSYGIGGIYTNDYSYDNLYRLSSANGSWDNGAMTNSFDLAMSYHPNGRIAEKQLRADVLDHLGSITTKHYDNLYSYPDGRNTLEKTEDQRSSQWQYFEWDNAGNMTMHRLHDECTRRLCWDEENRLQGVADCSYASLYQYDANGERTYKLTGQYSYQNINGHYYPYAVLENPTLYASPYVVCTPKGYTKHYYAESERVASKIGNGCLRDLCKSLNTDADFNREDEPVNPYLIDCGEVNEVFKRKLEHNNLYGNAIMECTSAGNFIVGSKLGNIYESIGCINEKEKECYWYHPDHLGSSSWITFTDGKAVQHLHYLPWGEDFVDQRLTSWAARYAFSAKERDAETGLSYFGARYYSSDLSIWLSVDPMSDKYPHESNYVYCSNNPIMVVDPNGEDEWEINRWGKVVNHIQTDQHDAFYIVDKNGNRIEGKELSFKYQTIEQFKSQYSDNAHKKFDWYNVRGDNNASELFEFLSDNTNVEWAQLLLGESGENGLNVISTSHEIDRNQAATFLIENKYKYGYTIRGSIHNHPNNTPYPSGLTSPGGDIAVAKYLCKISNKNGGGQPFFKIYTPKNGKYIKYNQNSLPSDFSYFMCRSVIISKKQ